MKTDNFMIIAALAALQAAGISLDDDPSTRANLILAEARTGRNWQNHLEGRQKYYKLRSERNEKGEERLRKKRER